MRCIVLRTVRDAAYSCARRTLAIRRIACHGDNRCRVPSGGDMRYYKPLGTDVQDPRDQRRCPLAQANKGRKAYCVGRPNVLLHLPQVKRAVFEVTYDEIEPGVAHNRSEENTSELQSQSNLVC